MNENEYVKELTNLLALVSTARAYSIDYINNEFRHIEDTIKRNIDTIQKNIDSMLEQQEVKERLK